MDDFDALDAGSEAAADESANVPESTRDKGRGGRGRGKGGGKSTGKSKVKNDSCYICPEKKLRNSKFCKDHNRAYENMKYQVQRDKEMPAFNQVMGDPGKAKVAIEDFLRDNPEGSSRKRLVEWASFKREQGVRVAFTVGEGEVLLDIDDYFVERAQPRGKTRQESDEAFKELMKGPYEREGEGPLTKLWLPKLKERMRDRTHYSDASMVEGSKQIKDVDRKEKEDLMLVCQSSVGGHDSTFIRSASSHGAVAIEAPVVKEEDQEEDSKAEKKQKKSSNVADERPKKYGKLKKERIYIFFTI